MRPSGRCTRSGNEADASLAETRSGSARRSGTLVEGLQRLLAVPEALEAGELAVLELGDVDDLRLDLHVAPATPSDRRQEDGEPVSDLVELVRLDSQLLPLLGRFLVPALEAAVAAVRARAEAASEERLDLHVVGEDRDKRVEIAGAPRRVGGAGLLDLAGFRHAAEVRRAAVVER